MEKIEINKELYYKLLCNLKTRHLLSLFEAKEISFDDLISARGDFLTRTKYKKYLKDEYYVKMSLKTYPKILRF